VITNPDHLRTQPRSGFSRTLVRDYVLISLPPHHRFPCHTNNTENFERWHFAPYERHRTHQNTKSLYDTFRRIFPEGSWTRLFDRELYGTGYNALRARTEQYEKLNVSGPPPSRSDRCTMVRKHVNEITGRIGPR
jgi:hypothetical protein